MKRQPCSLRKAMADATRQAEASCSPDDVRGRLSYVIGYIAADFPEFADCLLKVRDGEKSGQGASS